MACASGNEAMPTRSSRLVLSQVFDVQFQRQSRFYDRSVEREDRCRCEQEEMDGKIISQTAEQSMGGNRNRKVVSVQRGLYAFGGFAQ